MLVGVACVVVLKMVLQPHEISFYLIDYDIDLIYAFQYQLFYLMLSYSRKYT